MVAPALFGVGATSVPGIKLVGSQFLTSTLAGGIASAAASAFGQSKNKSVNFRGKYERNRAKFARKQLGPDTRARVEAVKSAGLHPLAALGITPGASSMSNAGSIPGQSPDYGSAISQGLRTAQTLATGQQQSAQSKTMAGLQLQEQQLRNNWLETQIAQSKLKMAAQIANSQQDGEIVPGPGATAPGNVVFSEHYKPTTGKTTGAQAIEDRYGELPGWAQGILNMGYDIAGNLLPPDFGKGRQWQGDNRPNDPTTGKPVARRYKIKMAPGGRPPWTPKRKPRRHTGRFRQY